MPYGRMSSTRRSSYLSGARSRRASGYATARTTVSKAPQSTSRFNAPVYRKLAKPRRAMKSKTGRNKMAITTLARQVKTLQNQRFGELQSHTQYLSLSGSTLPQSTRPVAFLLNNFYDQPIYTGIVTPSITGGIASFSQGHAFHRQGYVSTLDDQYEWNAARNSDLCSALEYKPVYTRLRMTFNFQVNNVKLEGRIRVTVLKINPYPASNKLDVSMPGALGAYRFLAETDNSVNRNYFRKEFHNVLVDKFINFKSRNMQAPGTSGDVDLQSRTVTIPWRYKDVCYKPDITTDPIGQTFWTNTPVSQQLWVLISCQNHLNGILQSVEIGKFDSWRDPHGV